MLLELQNIYKKFEIPSSTEYLTVLNDISLTVDKKETVSIIGPSGSGKSSLLNIIGAIDKPTAGEIYFDGKEISRLNDSELAKIRNEKIGFIFQLHHLLPQCTVLENVLIPTIPLNNGDKTALYERAKTLLSKVGLETHFNYFPAQLSGGELQRVAVVRALINKPKLILADEPTGALDQTASANLVKLLIELNRDEEAALIVVTHSLEIASLMNKTFALQNGKLIQKK